MTNHQIASTRENATPSRNRDGRTAWSCRSPPRPRADGVPFPHSEDHRSIPWRRHQRCAGSHSRRQASGEMGAAGGDRKQDRRGRQHRRKFAYQADPDGYTLLLAPPGPLAINQSLYKQLSYKPFEFVPLTVVGAVPNAVIVRKELPVNSLKELIIYVKAHPGQVTFGSQGNGATPHLTGMMFQAMTETRMVHVPYRGKILVLNDMLGGQCPRVLRKSGGSNPHSPGRPAENLRCRGRANISGFAGRSEHGRSWLARACLDRLVRPCRPAQGVAGSSVRDRRGRCRNDQDA